MKNKWYILLFIVLIAISLFAFQYVAELLSDAPRSLSLETQYLLNLPACIFVGIVDFLIIVIVHKRLDNINNTMRIFIDLLLASVWVSCFGIAAKLYPVYYSGGTLAGRLCSAENVSAGSTLE